MAVSADTSPRTPTHDRAADNPTPAGDGWVTGLLDGPAERSPWRLPAAIGAAGMAVSHIPVIEMHLSEAPYIGVGFILLTVAGMLLTPLLLTRDTVAVWSASLVVSALALLGYVLSRTVGLPQITDDVGNWGEPLGVVAIVAEAVLLLAAAAHLASSRNRRSS